MNRTLKDAESLVRSQVQGLQAYVPGEQPKVRDLVKLNTNENPYPPSPRVLEAIKAAVDDRLRLYPDPTSDALREKLARFHGCKPDQIIVTNGSDELLALATRAFVEPAPANAAGRPNGIWHPRPYRSLVQYFSPSYSLYPVLADIHGASRNPVSLRSDFGLPSPRELNHARQWDQRAALTFLTTPNAPSGRGYSTAEVERFCQAQLGVVVLDEAYADFAGENALKLALRHPHVLVARTFSKAYSLCFQRVGYAVGHSALIGALHKIKDSYNVNGLGQIAAQACLEDLSYYKANFKRLIATRERLARALNYLEFAVAPSAANFIFARPPGTSAETWLAQLRSRRVLVRWFPDPDTREYLRITVGTEEQVESLLAAIKATLASGAKGQ